MARPEQIPQAPREPRGSFSSKYKGMAAEPQRPSTPEKAGRSSFSSIRENDSGLAQAFTSSKVSSYTGLVADAVEDSTQPSTANSNTMLAAEFAPPLTQPQSRLHGVWYPADHSRGWKQIDVRGKEASRSFGDLQVLRMDWESTPISTQETVLEELMHDASFGAPIENLPQEIINAILQHLFLDVPPNGVDRRNVDLVSVLLTSRRMYAATLPTIYARVTIPHSRIFQKFLAQITTYPELGEMVRRLDFSHFNPSALFMTASERAQARNLTSETLLQCLNLTPNLQEFLGQDYVDDDISADVLRKLFTGLNKMEAVDFCGCSSAAFKNAFLEADVSSWPESLGIKRLSFHKCLTLPSSVFDAIMPRFKALTHLDAAGTKFTNAALNAIPKTAKITHLNLAKCNLLTADNVIDFFTTHEAVLTDLVFLSLSMDVRTHQMLDTGVVSELLPLLPRTLKSLSLRGSEMSPAHIERLRPLTKHLEELALGHGLTIQDIDKLFLRRGSDGPTTHSLKYLDLTDTSEILSTLYSDSILLKPQAWPLEVVEISEAVSKRVKASPSPLKSAGWRMEDLHTRSWLVRNADPRRPLDDGRRHWKLGAQFWGMRKIPVAMAEVGGMYGSYMFGRKL